jgi:RsiW-degrading membrane proteinase PrsW (M82 family)
MSVVFWAAATVTAVVGVVAVLAWDSWGRDTRILAAFVIGLPLSALVNPYVKTPIILWLEAVTQPSASGAAPWRFLWLVLWVAPLVEEAAKLLPLVAPVIRESLGSPRIPLRIGLAAGSGFGLGEAWYLALGMSRTPGYAAVQFSSMASYISERLIITLAHGAMTAVAVSGFAGRPSPLGGYALAVFLHGFLNAGSLAYQAGLISLASRNVAMLASIVLLAVAFQRIRRSVNV